MPKLGLHHVQLMRVAREAREDDDRELYGRAVAGLERCACGDVGDDVPMTPARLRSLLDGLAAEVNAFQWSEATVHAADAENSSTVSSRQVLQHVRESAQENMRGGISEARARIAAGDLPGAENIYQRLLTRWARFEQQASAIGRNAALASRSWAERYTDNVEEGMQRVNEAMTPSSPLTLPLLVGGLLFLLLAR